MAIYSIGAGGSIYDPDSYGDDAPEPDELVQVEADSPTSVITRLINTGDDDAHQMAADDIARAHQHGRTPTPNSIAASIAGGGATVNQVG